MSKQSVFQVHKDEMVKELVRRLEKAVVFKQNSISGVSSNRNNEAEAVNHGWIQCLKWGLELDKTEEEKNEEFSQSIDQLTNKESNNDNNNN